MFQFIKIRAGYSESSLKFKAQPSTVLDVDGSCAQGWLFHAQKSCNKCSLKTHVACCEWLLSDLSHSVVGPLQCFGKVSPLLDGSLYPSFKLSIFLVQNTSIGFFKEGGFLLKM